MKWNGSNVSAPANSNSFYNTFLISLPSNSFIQAKEEMKPMELSGIGFVSLGRLEWVNLVGYGGSAPSPQLNFTPDNFLSCVSSSLVELFHCCSAEKETNPPFVFD